MELDWSTLLLEIVNVLVLIWLLKRFLFRPVMAVIEERKAAITKSVADAQSVRQEAQVLQERYEQRLVEWDKEKETVRGQLQEDIAAERRRRLEILQVEIDRAKAQHAARESEQMKQLVRQVETTAILHGTQFAAALLSRIASPELEAKLIDAAAQDLSNLSSKQIETVTSALPAGARGRLTTAYPLEMSRRDQLVKQIESLFGRKLEWEFIEDRDLLAGLRVSLGGWVLRGNLQDELKFFAEGETGVC